MTRHSKKGDVIANGAKSVFPRLEKNAFKFFPINTSMYSVAFVRYHNVTLPSLHLCVDV